MARKTAGKVDIVKVRQEVPPIEDPIFREFFYQNQSAMFITGADATILEVNASFSRITGYKREEIIGMSPALMKSNRHNREFYRQFWEALLEKGYWEGEIWDTRKDGREYPKWMTISALRNDAGEITHYLAIFSDISEMKKSQDFFRFLARHDSLTHLPNRLAFAEHVLLKFQDNERTGSRLAIAFLDLDGFKQINDQMGHLAGDRLLELVGERMVGSVKDTDMVARHGGDEFVICLSKIKDADDVEQVLRRIIDSLEQPYKLDDREIKISVSVGVALFPDNGETLEILLKRADAAMYAAKDTPDTNIFFFNDVRRRQ